MATKEENTIGQRSTEGNSALVTLEDLLAARRIVESSEHCTRTPLLKNVQTMFGMKDINLFMKLENMQVTGSFKIRGVINQLHDLPPGTGSEKHKIVTASAGNYGKAFGYLASKLGLKGLVLLPDTAPQNRTKVIEDFGVETERTSTTELWPTIHRYERERGMVEMHSFDDIKLALGYASVGFEILEDMTEGGDGTPDVVLVCCGGGGLLSGISAAIKLSCNNSKCKVYGVEPYGARTMYESFEQGKAVSMDVKTVASGLSPPKAGENTYRYCKEFADGIILVTDEEIVSALYVLYDRGLVVEPSGAAAFAALYHNKVAAATRESKVVVVITGGNISPEELVDLQRYTK